MTDAGKRLIRAATQAKEMVATMSMEPVAWAGAGDDGVIDIAERRDIAEQWLSDGLTVEPLVRLSDAEARIATLERELRAAKDAHMSILAEERARAEAAEALMKEVGPAIEKAMAILRELEGKLPHALGMAVGDAIDQLRLPVSAARAIHHKIGGGE